MPANFFGAAQRAIDDTMPRLYLAGLYWHSAPSELPPAQRTMRPRHSRACPRLRASIAARSPARWKGCSPAASSV